MEYHLPISSTQVEEAIGYSFSAGRVHLKTGPDIIMVGEIRDLEAKTAINSADRPLFSPPCTPTTPPAPSPLDRPQGQSDQHRPAINISMAQRCENSVINAKKNSRLQNWSQPSLKSACHLSGKQKPSRHAKIFIWKAKGCQFATTSATKEESGFMSDIDRRWSWTAHPP